MLCTQGNLELDELEEGSPLEMCYLLGKLQEPGEPSTVDLVGACMLVSKRSAVLKA
jgi:hypothetical protein